MVDMNLVSLIDVFTILIFFLLSNTGGVETLASPRAVKLPESMSQQAPKETLMVDRHRDRDPGRRPRRRLGRRRDERSTAT